MVQSLNGATNENDGVRTENGLLLAIRYTCFLSFDEKSMLMYAGPLYSCVELRPREKCEALHHPSTAIIAFGNAMCRPSYGVGPIIAGPLFNSASQRTSRSRFSLSGKDVFV